MGDPQVRAFLLRKLAEEYPDEKLAAEQTAWVHFGFLAATDDLKELYLGMLSEQAAGFYDPVDGRLIVVSGKPFPGIALVHELAHALADQVFDLERLLNAARPNDDALMAVSAMIEGEAMTLSTSYVRSPAGAGLREEESIEVAATDTPSDPIRLPPMLQHSFTFPYTAGMTWATQVTKGGPSEMDRFYHEPPESTEQIMHPEKSGVPRDRPSVIPSEILKLAGPVLEGAGYLPVKENLLGEFGVRELFGGSGEPQAVGAADGWDGDLFSVQRGADGATALIWITVWDSTQDADQFSEQAGAWLARRGAADRYRVARTGPEGRGVLLIEGFGPERNGRIEAALSPAIAGKVTLR